MLRGWGRIAALALALTLALTFSASAQRSTPPARPNYDSGLHITEDESRAPAWRFGDLEAGAMVAQVPIHYRMTGRIVADVMGDGGSFSRDRIVIPAGTPVFAATARETSLGSLPRVWRAARWCGVLDAPSDLLLNGRGFCLDMMELANTPGTFQVGAITGVHFLASTPEGVGSLYFPTTARVAGRVRSDVTVVAEPQPALAQLSLGFRVMPAQAEWINVGVFGLDGVSETRLDVIRIARGEPTTITIGGRDLRFEYLANDLLRVGPAEAILTDRRRGRADTAQS